MTTPPNPPRAAARIALMALAIAPCATRADTPPTNADRRYVSIGAESDGAHDRQWLSTLSLPVGRHAWAQAGVGKSRNDPRAGGGRSGILTGAAGVDGQAMQWSVDAVRRSDAGRIGQTDLGTSLDWRHGGDHVGVDLTHRRSVAATTLAGPGLAGGSTTVPAQTRVSGTGAGVHGTLQVGERLSFTAAVVRNHYKSSTRQIDPAATGGLPASDPTGTRAWLAGSSVLDRDEVALDHSARLGAAYRWSHVAVSGEYASGRLHDDGGTLRSVALTAAVELAPGWRLAPGVGRGSGAQGGHATFASLSATYGW